METVFGVCPVHGAVAMWADDSFVPFEQQVCSMHERDSAGDELSICLLELELRVGSNGGTAVADENHIA